MKITDKIELFNCDNMELMKKYPDNYFDLAIVDPPYGINATNMQMGSASIAISADKYKVELIACELNEVYFNDSIKIVIKKLAQQKLF